MSEILINIQIVNPKKSFGIFGNLNSVQVISEHAQISKMFTFLRPENPKIFDESLKKFARAKVESDYKGDF